MTADLWAVLLAVAGIAVFLIYYIWKRKLKRQERDHFSAQFKKEEERK